MIEMTRKNVQIDSMLDVNYDWVPPSIVAYIEMWFDVDEKFGTHTSSEGDTWINLYAMYDPIGNGFHMEYYIESDCGTSDPIPYTPSDAERETIITMIEEKCQEVEGCTCAALLAGEE